MKFIWFVVIGFSVLGLLLLFVSVRDSAMAQASVGAMVGAFVVTLYVIARGIEGFGEAGRRSAQRRREREAD
jgi:hypothetical protein